MGNGVAGLVRESVVRAVAVVAGIVVVVLGCLLVYGRTRLVVADPVYGPKAVEGLDRAFDVVLDSFNTSAGLATTAFGVVAFLVMYQVKKGVTPSPRAWAALAAGLVFFAGALGLALLGVDTLLFMLASNAVDLSLGALQYARWAMYLFMVAALTLVGVFAMEVMLVPSTSRPSSEEDS